MIFLSTWRKCPVAILKSASERGDNPSADLSGEPGGIDACGTVFESSAAALGRGKCLSDAAEEYVQQYAAFA